jgi:hypothetical protein
MTSLISLCSLLSSSQSTTSLQTPLPIRSIQTLELSNCKLARQAGIILGQSLQHCKTLKRLILSDNNLRDGGVRAITDALKNIYTSTLSGDDDDVDPAVRMEVLDLSRNGFSSVGFFYLSTLQIEKVHVAGNNIGTGIGPFLLSTKASLVELDLSHNALTEKGFQEIFMTLSTLSNCRLKILKLYHCQLKAKEALFLKQILTTWKTSYGLEELWLGEEQEKEEDQDDQETCMTTTINTSRNSTMDRCILLEDIRSMAKLKFPNLHIVLIGTLSSSTSTTKMNPLATKNDQLNMNSTAKSSTKFNSSGSGSSTGRKSSFGIRVRMASSSYNKPIQIQRHTATKSSIKDPPPTTSSTRKTEEEEDSQEWIEEEEVHEFTEQELDQTISTSCTVPPESTTEKIAQNDCIPSTSSVESMKVYSGALLNHEQVEYIVTKTIENMNSNFEKRLQEFVTQMETTQQLHVSFSWTFFSQSNIFTKRI